MLFFVWIFDCEEFTEALRASGIGALSRFRTLILQNFLLSNQCRVHLCCRFDSGMYCVIHFLIFKRRTISAITVDSPGVVICINVFKYELICMIVIANLKSVQPFSFNQCMERLDTSVVPWISFSGVALFNSLC